MLDVTLGLAFFAGIISFISPCVLPLVPAYIGYMGGRMTHTVASRVEAGAQGGVAVASYGLAARFSTLLHGVAFVAGFTLVFVLIGVATTALIQQVGGQNVFEITALIGRVGGVVIIFFGLHFMGVIPSVLRWLKRERPAAGDRALVIALAALGTGVLLWGFGGSLMIWDSSLWRNPDGSPSPTLWAPVIGLALALLYLVALVLGGAFSNPRLFLVKLANTINLAFYSDTRRQMDMQGNHGLTGSLFMGVVFSAGWTPCIGPIYGAILTVSATTGDVGQALPLLTAYSLGLGIPFLLAALALDGAQGIVRRLNRRMKTIKLVSGVFLVLIGLLVASGTLQTVSADFAVQFADLSILIEQCALGWVEGQIGFGQLGACLSGAESFEALRAAHAG